MGKFNFGDGLATTEEVEMIPIYLNLYDKSILSSRDIILKSIQKEQPGSLDSSGIMHDKSRKTKPIFTDKSETILGLTWDHSTRPCPFFNLVTSKAVTVSYSEQHPLSPEPPNGHIFYANGKHRLKLLSIRKLPSWVHLHSCSVIESRCPSHVLRLALIFPRCCKVSVG